MRKAALLYAGLPVATAAVFARSLTCGFVGYDDRGYVLDNTRVLGGLGMDGLRWAFTTTRQANWHPLTWLSLMLDATVGGADPAVYHATSVALHALASVLLLRVLHLATGELARSATVAALFALHPLRVESVTWISERKDVLAAVFWMGTLLCWLRFRLEGRCRAHIAACLLFACGLLAKPMLVTLPAVLLLLERWPLTPALRPRGWRPVLIALAPLAVLAAASAAVTLWAQRAGGAVGTFHGFPVGARLANAAVGAAAYLGDLVWPAGLAVPYPYRWETIAPPRVLAALAVLLALSAVAATARRRPWARLGWLWYLVTLLPVSGLVQVGEQSRADRYTYLPSIGLAIWLVWDAAALAAFLLPDPRTRRRALLAAAVLALVPLAAVTWAQQAHWKDSFSLWRRALAVTEQNAVAHDGYGLELYREGREAEALPHFQEAVRLSPQTTRSHVNLGAALSRLSRYDEAVAQLEIAVSQQPESAALRAELAAMLLRAGRREEAEALAREVLRAAPGEARAREVVGMAEALRGDLPAEPGARTGEQWVAIGLSLLRERKVAEAEEALRRAVEVEPTLPSGHTNLGVLLAQTGRVAEALPHFEEAARLSPGDAGARRNLEKVRARLRR
jgi:Flp pilus assembly protein TadD